MVFMGGEKGAQAEEYNAKRLAYGVDLIRWDSFAMPNGGRTRRTNRRAQRRGMRKLQASPVRQDDIAQGGVPPSKLVQFHVPMRSYMLVGNS